MAHILYPDHDADHADDANEVIEMQESHTLDDDEMKIKDEGETKI